MAGIRVENTLDFIRMCICIYMYSLFQNCIPDSNSGYIGNEIKLLWQMRRNKQDLSNLQVSRKQKISSKQYWSQIRSMRHPRFSCKSTCMNITPDTSSDAMYAHEVCSKIYGPVLFNQKHLQNLWAKFSLGRNAWKTSINLNKQKKYLQVEKEEMIDAISHPWKTWLNWKTREY